MSMLYSKKKSVDQTKLTPRSRRYLRETQMFPKDIIKIIGAFLLRVIFVQAFDLGVALD